MNRSYRISREKPLKKKYNNRFLNMFSMQLVAFVNGVVRKMSSWNWYFGFLAPCY